MRPGSDWASVNRPMVVIGRLPARGIPACWPEHPERRPVPIMAAQVGHGAEALADQGRGGRRGLEGHADAVSLLPTAGRRNALRGR
jgi:hypothetical protein